MDEVYKIVYFQDDASRSFWIDGAAKVTYFPNIEAQAPDFLREEGYHLLAFDTLENAGKWHRIGDRLPILTMPRRLELWRAIGRDKVELPPRLDIMSLEHGFFTDAKDGEWPEGTVMYKGLTLIERIR